MRRWMFGVVSAIIVTCSAIALSYVVLNQLYGTPKIEVTWMGIAPMTWENAQRLEPIVLSWQTTYDVGKPFEISNNAWFLNARPTPWSAVNGSENIILTCENDYVVYPDNTYHLDYLIPLTWKNAENLKSAVLTVVAGAGIYETFYGSSAVGEYSTWGTNPRIPEGNVEMGTGGVNVNTFVHEKDSIPVLPVSAIIGISMGFMVFSVWIGYKRMWGDAASTLLEQGLHDMTVRDVEIVGQIMDLKEFTIPELIRQTGASKITVWRTVQKLIEQGLVKQIEQTKPAANGLGGRGKPSHVYKYVGAPSSETSNKR